MQTTTYNVGLELMHSYIFYLIFQLAEQTFKEALGEGIWLSVLDGRIGSSKVDCSAYCVQYRDFSLFQQLEVEGTSLDLPWDNITTLFNLARLLEQLQETGKASILYHLILFKVSSCVCVWAHTCPHVPISCLFAYNYVYICMHLRLHASNYA